MIEVRKANVEDLGWMLEQAKQFLSYHPLPVAFNGAHITNIILDMIDDGIILVASEAGVKLGAIGGVVSPNFFDPSYQILSELFLWVEKKHRKTRAMHHLVTEFSKLGEDYDAVALSHTKLTPSLGRVFEKRYGYELLEVTYTKEK